MVVARQLLALTSDGRADGAAAVRPTASGLRPPGLTGSLRASTGAAGGRSAASSASDRAATRRQRLRLAAVAEQADRGALDRLGQLRVGQLALAPHQASTGRPAPRGAGDPRPRLAEMEDDARRRVRRDSRWMTSTRSRPAAAPATADRQDTLRVVALEQQENQPPGLSAPAAEAWRAAGRSPRRHRPDRRRRRAAPGGSVSAASRPSSHAVARYSKLSSSTLGAEALGAPEHQVDSLRRQVLADDSRHDSGSRARSPPRCRRARRSPPRSERLRRSRPTARDRRSHVAEGLPRRGARRSPRAGGVTRAGGRGRPRCGARRRGRDSRSGGWPAGGRRQGPAA